MKIITNSLKGTALTEEKKLEKNVPFFSLQHPATHECPQKNSTQSVQPFGRLYATYIYIYIRMSCFII